MATKVYKFKITYANCDNRIWRIAEITSNRPLAELGYLVLATFETMAYHLFEFKFNGTTFVFTDELPYNDDEKYAFLIFYKIGKLGLEVGDVIEMIYDMGCQQVFDIELLEVSDMPPKGGRAYPKIIDGAGRGIIDDMPALDLLKVIRKIDRGGHSKIYYSIDDYADDDHLPEWDYRTYNIDADNSLLKGNIALIRDGYECFDDDDF